MNLRVSLAPARPGPKATTDGYDGPMPLLDPSGARVELGMPSKGTAPAAPIAPAADTLFGPRGVALGPHGSPLVVCDTGHHRLMIWNSTPLFDNAPADLIIGQPHFESEGRNGNGKPGPATLNVPTGVAIQDGVLAVADAWNHRVLIWQCLPIQSNQSADLVLGQADFASTRANRGADASRSDTLNWCYGVAIHEGRLYVADTGNRRVLVWDRIPERNGVAADLVLGQRDFTRRDEGGADPATGMRWPHAITVVDDTLLVADAGNSRIMGWVGLPQMSGQFCDFVLGQRHVRAREHNASEYHPTAASMNMPYGLCRAADRLVVADTANSRLLGFDLGTFATGRAATRLTGQLTFADKGDNRWGPPMRDSLCWPHGVSAIGTTVAVADSGNNRVLLWEVA